VLTFEHVTVVAPEDPGRRILEDVDITLPASGVTAVAGPSGAGKTMLLRLCNRLDIPTAGRVLFYGRDVASLDPLRLRREVGMVFQRPVLFGGTVADNLRVADPGADIERLLGEVHLDSALAGREAATLSGGEAQRLCLARALVCRPRVLLADEPTSALDAEPRTAFERLVRRLSGEGLAVIWVTHDLKQLWRVADHLVVLDRGRVLYSGLRPSRPEDAGAAAAFLTHAAG
jgi:putative ABC transport system ATP-binding protein